MGCVITVLAAIVPRLLLLASWANDQAGWASAFGSPLWPVLGFLFVPWTTFFFALFAPGGFGVLSIVLLLVAVLVDVGTWGGGVFGNRKRVSSYYGRD
jgi:hypothetical protein